MAGVKTIRGTFFEVTYFDREYSRIRCFESLSERSRIDPKLTFDVRRQTDCS